MINILYAFQSLLLSKKTRFFILRTNFLSSSQLISFQVSKHAHFKQANFFV